MITYILTQILILIFDYWVETIVKQFWDVFHEDGVHTPVHGYEFHIDTGTNKPVKCHQPHYPLHAIPIIDKHIEKLLSLGFIQEE